MIGRDADIFQNNIAGFGEVEAHLVLLLAQLHAPLFLHEEGGYTLAGPLCLIRPGRDQEIFCVGGVRTEALRSIDDPLVAVLHGSGAHGGRVGPCTGFRHGQGPHGPAEDAVSPHLLFCLGHLAEEDLVEVAAGAGEGERKTCVDLTHLLQDNTLGHRIEAQTTPFF